MDILESEWVGEKFEHLGEITYVVPVDIDPCLNFKVGYIRSEFFQICTDYVESRSVSFLKES